MRVTVFDSSLTLFLPMLCRPSFERHVSNALWKHPVSLSSDLSGVPSLRPTTGRAEAPNASQPEDAERRASKRRSSDQNGVACGGRTSGSSSEGLVSCHSAPLAEFLHLPAMTSSHCSSAIVDSSLESETDRQSTGSTLTSSTAAQHQQWLVRRRAVVSKSWVLSGGGAVNDPLGQTDNCPPGIQRTSSLGSDPAQELLVQSAVDNQVVAVGSFSGAGSAKLPPSCPVQTSGITDTDQFAIPGPDTILISQTGAKGEKGLACFESNTTPTMAVTPTGLFDLPANAVDPTVEGCFEGFRISTVLTCGSSASASEGGSSSDKQAKRDRHRRAAAAAAIEQPSGTFGPASSFVPIPGAFTVPFGYESDDELGPELSDRGYLLSHERECMTICKSQGGMQEEGWSGFRDGSKRYGIWQQASGSPSAQAGSPSDTPLMLPLEDDEEFETPPPTPNSGELDL